MFRVQISGIPERSTILFIINLSALFLFWATELAGRAENTDFLFGEYGFEYGFSVLIPSLVSIGRFSTYAK